MAEYRYQVSSIGPTRYWTAMPRSAALLWPFYKLQLKNLKSKEKIAIHFMPFEVEMLDWDGYSRSFFIKMYLSKVQLVSLLVSNILGECFHFVNLFS